MGKRYVPRPLWMNTKYEDICVPFNVYQRSVAAEKAFIDQRYRLTRPIHISLPVVFCFAFIHAMPPFTVSNNKFAFYLLKHIKHNFFWSACCSISIVYCFCCFSFIVSYCFMSPINLNLLLVIEFKNYS